jgi:hypothetical protein
MKQPKPGMEYAQPLPQTQFRRGQLSSSHKLAGSIPNPLVGESNASARKAVIKQEYSDYIRRSMERDKRSNSQRSKRAIYAKKNPNYRPF